MSDDLTKAQWRRRALKAEAELESLRRIYFVNSEMLTTEARAIGHYKIILREIRELLNEAPND